MKTLQQLGTDLGALLEEKNTAYGSSFAASGDFLRLLFPRGVPADRYDDALLLVRIFDKQMRIATNNDAFGESPYQDIAGYGLLGTQLHQQRKDSATCPGSASGPNASSSSKAQRGFAAPGINATTTTSESARAASEPSLQPASSSAASATAAAPTATENASASAEDLRRLNRNNAGKCARETCGCPLLSHGGPYLVSGESFQYCCEKCLEIDWMVRHNHE